MKKIAKLTFIVLILMMISSCSNSKNYTEEDFDLKYEIMLDFDDKWKIEGDIINKSKRKDFKNVKLQFDLTTKDGKKVDAGTTVIDEVNKKYSSHFVMDIDDFMRKNNYDFTNIVEIKANLVQ